MKPPKFDYFAPDTLEEALGLLARHGADARLLAGGQSLMPMLNFRLARPSVLVDLNRIPGLSGIGNGEGTLRVGAMTRQRDIEESTAVARAVPLLHEATGHIAHLPIRTRGTIGGSIANADPAAEDPAVAVALDATMVCRSARGERRIAAAVFFRDVLTTALEADEILTAIEFPVSARPGAGSAFVEISRREGDFALAGIAAQITLDGGKVGAARIAGCGIGPAPMRIAGAEAAIQGTAADADAIAAGARAVAEAADPHGDVHASADYRRKLAGAMAARAIARAVGRASGAER